MSRVLLGMLTPSSNTVLEPVTAAMLSGLPEVSAHFSRFPVTEIALSGQALAQFDLGEIIGAARLLAHAKVSAVCWNGTSAGWRGFATDEQLCRELERTLRIPACTSVLALNEIFALTKVKRFALVTPYLASVQSAIVENYRSVGFDCVAEQHLDLQDNFSFSEVEPDRLRAMLRGVAQAKPDAIAIFCTNLTGAPLAVEMERELAIPIYDTVATAVWKSLKLCGIDTRRVKGWGSLFERGN